MIKWMLHSIIRKMEVMIDYDGTYMHEMVDASTSAGLKFMFAQGVARHREGVSKDAWHAARFAATLSEDCGPCAQLCVTMALRDRVDPLKIAALVRGDLAAAGDEAAFGYRYGMAVATNSPEALDFVEEALKRFGERGRVSLALAVAGARIYPALKRGLGHGVACAKINVANESIAVKHVA